eukprot:TRINITY_DN6314_c0_g1_i2.p1 TRINITY_DN6314_c0_g1~~TRINITY_DN6314_c0_g1_i2.p1  ORF type:complete len:145 (-),score=39.93 TRINITY_DN6314_c0_g1_i2:36-449(-)
MEQQKNKNKNPEEWTIPTIAVDENGDSYFTERKIKLNNKTNIGTLSELIAVKGAQLRYTGGDYDISWHCAPCRQLIVNLNESVEVTTSQKGESKILPAGEVFLVEDTTGKGHQSKSPNKQGRYSIFLPLADDFKGFD